MLEVESPHVSQYGFVHHVASLRKLARLLRDIRVYRISINIFLFVGRTRDFRSGLEVEREFLIGDLGIRSAHTLIVGLNSRGILGLSWGI